MDSLLLSLRARPNRGITHVFLGDPMSDAADKTTVEPGNAFSPGVWTCGASVHVEVGGELFSPDAIEGDWRFDESEGFSPVLLSRVRCGDDLTLENRLTHRGGEGSEGADFCGVELYASRAVKGRLLVCVRDIGPAGGHLSHLAWNGVALELDGGARLTPRRAPDAVLVSPPDEAFDCPAALLAFDFDLLEGQSAFVAFKTEHGFAHRAFGNAVPLARPFEHLDVTDALQSAYAQWKIALPSRVWCPDPRVEGAWNGAGFHILAAMENGLPRIGAVNYPTFWIRDAVLVLRALDAIARADLARIGCDFLSTLDFGGGFGAESDAPGEGIWALCEHGAITGDTQWMREQMPHIARRVRWIEKMLDAKAPIRRASDGRIPHYGLAPSSSILCLASQNGLIHGRMDWHSPDFYINCWALAGLRLAIQAAKSVGQSAQVAGWQARADALEAALDSHGLEQWGQERDPAVAPHPSGYGQNNPTMRAKFEAWYRENRLNPDGSRRAERAWTYFEAAHAHNALLLGFREWAWVTLEGMLSDGQNNQWAWSEGEPGKSEFLPFGNGEGRRGWLDPALSRAGNMPHNWTSAELLLALRSVFVVERDGEPLQLGMGVPASWRQSGARFGVENLPIRGGKLSFEATFQGDKWNFAANAPREWRDATGEVEAI